jgi:hypothetical protein
LPTPNGDDISDSLVKKNKRYTSFISVSSSYLSLEDAFNESRAFGHHDGSMWQRVGYTLVPVSSPLAEPLPLCPVNLEKPSHYSSRKLAMIPRIWLIRPINYIEHFPRDK